MELKIKSVFNLRNLVYILLPLNLVNLVFTISYVLIPFDNFLWIIFGILILINFIGNFLLVYVNSMNLNRSFKLGKQLNLLCYIYLIFFTNGMLLTLFGNFFISVNYSSTILSNIGFYIMVYGGFMGILLLGALISYINFKNLDNTRLWNKDQLENGKIRRYNSYIKKTLKTILALFSILVFGVSFYLAYVITISPLNDYLAWLIGMLVPQFHLFLAFILLSTTVLFLKLLNPKKRKKLKISIAAIGLLLSFVFFLPVISTPTIYVQAESDFSIAYGSNWRTKIDSSINQYFMDSPFNLAEYFVGNQPKDCNVDQNITFYEGEGITLCYDAYYLVSGGTDLPGNNSVLINIHGGAWAAGDKGMTNMIQVSKYFAAQGYVVFDIQYGLINTSSSWIPTPDHVKGNFSLNDQVRHIGIFIKQLNNTEFSKYNLNLNSVFITGNSAGGHLTIATSLMIQSGNYTNLFGSNIKVKGMIPLYPGDPPESLISGTDKFRNPENYFINATSVPCLIFQGTKDFCLLETQHIKNQYDSAGNNDCCVIWFPFQGHANDLYYSGHFNQFKLYYMERFLYLCLTNQIE